MKFHVSGFALLRNVMRQRKQNIPIGVRKFLPAGCQLTTVLGLLLSLLLGLATLARAQSAQTTTTSPDFQGVIARQASLVSEFEINGLKVLVKRREGSQTVATGLFIRGGGENITTSNAGVEAFMLNVASEATAHIPPGRLRQ